MAALTFAHTDREIATAFYEGGRMMLVGEFRGTVASLRYALSIPEGQSAEDIEIAHRNAVEGSPEQLRLRQTMPFFGATIGWFASIEDGIAILESAASATDLADPDVQLRQAGFKPYLCLANGTRVYDRPLTGSSSSNRFTIIVAGDGVSLSFERRSTSQELLTLSASTDGEGWHATPAFLDDQRARVACAIAQADRYLQTGRTQRRRKAA